MIRERIERELNENEQLRKYIRQVANCIGKPYPLVLVNGDLIPTRVGRRGVRVGIHQINYGTPLWIMPHYARSTLRIEVGSDWLMEELMTRNYLKVKHGKEKENGTT